MVKATSISAHISDSHANAEVNTWDLYSKMRELAFKEHLRVHGFVPEPNNFLKSEVELVGK